MMKIGLRLAGTRVTLSVVFLLAMFLWPTGFARAAGSFVVTNTNDSGPGSLCQAILNANSQSNPPGALITFNIPKTDFGFGLTTPGVWTIRPVNPLPDLSGGVTTIDGESQKTNQGDTNPNGLNLEIDGTNLGPTGAILTITSGYNTIKDLTLNNAGAGIAIIGTGQFTPSGNDITGCTIGADANGKTARPNVTGIDLHGGVTGTTIEHNVIAGNTTDGIEIAGGGNDKNTIDDNLFGEVFMVGNPLPNGRHAIFINSGPAETLIKGNYIGASGMHGVFIASANETTITGNTIGGYNSHPAMDGIRVEGGSSSTTISQNSVWWSGNDGIWVDGAGTTAAVSANDVGNATLHGIAVYDGAGPVSVHGNIVWYAGWSGVAIVNSSQVTVTDNDIGVNRGVPADHRGSGYYGVGIVNGSSNVVGPGNWIAYNASDGVYISGATSTGNTITQNAIFANGGKGIHLDKGANANAQPPKLSQASCAGVKGTAAPITKVEVFSDAGNEGRIFLGSTIDNTTPFAWTGTFPGPNITATDTDIQGNTSEFSTPLAGACLKVYMPVTIH